MYPTNIILFTTNLKQKFRIIAPRIDPVLWYSTSTTVPKSNTTMGCKKNYKYRKINVYPLRAPYYTFIHIIHINLLKVEICNVSKYIVLTVYLLWMNWSVRFRAEKPKCQHAKCKCNLKGIPNPYNAKMKLKY